MSSWTERQLATALAWMEEEMGVPSRSDWYAMQVAQQVHSVQGLFTKGFKPPDPGEFQLRFKSQTTATGAEGDSGTGSDGETGHRQGTTSTKSKVTREQAAAWSKAKWFGALGIDPSKQEAKK